MVVNRRSQTPRPDSALDLKTKGINRWCGSYQGEPQKVVFAKALFTEAKVFLCDEPPKGLISGPGKRSTTCSGKAEPGLMPWSCFLGSARTLDVVDNIVILTEGRTTRVLKNENLTSEQVLAHCYAGTQAKESSR